MSRGCQLTVVNGVTSSTLAIDCGVPQGSVLGPLLFHIYINGIISNLRHCVHYMYVNDLAIAVSNRDPDIVRILLQGDLTLTGDWCDAFHLTVNSDKSHVLWGHPNDGLNYDDYQIVMKNKVLKTYAFSIT